VWPQEEATAPRVVDDEPRDEPRDVPRHPDAREGEVVDDERRNEPHDEPRGVGDVDDDKR
jgi:hypothetical protein